jgi:uncharacterized membrane protein YphA (DoxX/SURF4 family)
VTSPFPKWFAPAPVARLDALTRVAYLLVLFMVFRNDNFAMAHGEAPRSFYRPVAIGRFLHIPAPTHTTLVLLEIVITAACLIGFTRRAPQITAFVVLVAFGLWISWAFGYGKVDHDRLTILVAFAAFACTPRTGPSVEEKTGWASRLIQVVFVLAYPFSAITKLRLAGLRWPESAVFARAIIRRGTPMGHWLLTPPIMLQIGQWAFLGFELFAVVAIVKPGKVRNTALVGILFLHLFTWSTIGISFVAHTTFLLAFLPLERWSPWVRTKFGRRPDQPIFRRRPSHPESALQPA